MPEEAPRISAQRSRSSVMVLLRDVSGARRQGPRPARRSLAARGGPAGATAGRTWTGLPCVSPATDRVRGGCAPRLPPRPTAEEETMTLSGVSVIPAALIAIL